MIYTIRSQSILNPQFCCIGMCTSFKNSRGTDLKGSTVFRNHQLNVVIALQDLIDSVMQKTNTDDTLARTYHLGRTGTGLGILCNILIKCFKIFHSLIMTLHLNHGIDNQLRSTGCIGVGQHDQTFVLFFCQVIPCLRCFQTQTLQLFRIYHKAKDTFVDTIPAVGRILVIVTDQVLGIFRLIWHQQVVRNCLVVRIGGSAEPDIR